MPTEKLFPAMLAIVCVNVGPVPEAPLIVTTKFVVAFHHLHNVTKALQLFRRQAFDVLANFSLARFRTEFVN